MKDILLVEDDLRIAKLVMRYLVSEGFNVVHVEEGNKAVDEIIHRNPDLVILDMMLPGKDGIEVCQAVRSRFNNPILMLTAHDDDLNHVLALNSGIDDYLTKPIKPEILLARINALLRRTAAVMSERLTVQDLQIDNAKRSVSRDGNLIELTDSDFELLKVFVSHVGIVINRDQIFSQVLDIDFNGSDRSIDMRVSKLRKKLGDTKMPYRYIKTIRNRGYVFMKERFL
ncbi:MAG: response regulator transcription factor [Oleispira sp.]